MLHLLVEPGYRNGILMMKYAVNHPEKFRVYPSKSAVEFMLFIRQFTVVGKTRNTLPHMLVQFVQETIKGAKPLMKLIEPSTFAERFANSMNLKVRLHLETKNL